MGIVCESRMNILLPLPLWVGSKRLVSTNTQFSFAFTQTAKISTSLLAPRVDFLLKENRVFTPIAAASRGLLRPWARRLRAEAR